MGSSSTTTFSAKAQTKTGTPTVGGNYGPDDIRFEAGESHDFPLSVYATLSAQGLFAAPAPTEDAPSTTTDEVSS